MKLLRIGMVTACYKPVINGVTQMVSQYKILLEQLGHEVTIFTLGEPDPAGDEPGVMRSPGIPLGDTGYYFGLGYRPRMREVVAEMDILHCHHLFMSVELAHRYGRSPIVFTNHTRNDLYAGTYTPLPQPAANAIMRQIWPELADLADVVVAPSPGLAEVLRQFGVRARIEVIPNGVNLESFWQPSRSISRADLGIDDQAWPLLIYTGRLAAEKRLDELIEQFAIVREHFPRAYLLLVGSGPKLAALQSLIDLLGLNDAVGFAGSVAFASVPDYLALADIFVTASTSEVHPLTVIEAMASGLAVAAIRSPGISDTVASGESGILAANTAGLAAAIVMLAADRHRCRKLGQQARQASQLYDIRRTVLQTLDLYYELLDGRQKAAADRLQSDSTWLPERLQSQLEQLARLLVLGGGRHGPSA